MLTDLQTELIESWVGPFRLTQDLSWGLVDSRVARAHCGAGDIIIKTAGPDNNHMAREIEAYERVVPLLASEGWAPDLLGSSLESRLLVTTYVPGDLAERTGAQDDPDFLVQAGTALRLLHSLDHATDETLERNLTKKTLRWLSKPHNIPPGQAERARVILEEALAGSPVAVCACHGDYSPRNWMDDGGRLTVIDFGRFGHRPPSSDLIRMYYRQWTGNPSLKDAFAEGYGDVDEMISSPEWGLAFLREAISTAGWAHKVGDTDFEREGLALIGPALEMIE